MKLASCKSALNSPVVYSTDRSKAVVPVLVLLFVALWFILRGDLLYVFPCVILFLCFSVLLVLWLPCLGKRELILVLFVRLFDLCLFGFVGFLFLLGSGKGWGLWLWHSLDFSLTLFFTYRYIVTLSLLWIQSILTICLFKLVGGTYVFLRKHCSSFTEMFLLWSFTKIAKMVLFGWTKWPPELKKKKKKRV